MVDSVVVHYLKNFTDRARITKEFKWKIRNNFEVNIDFNHSKNQLIVSLTAIGPDAKMRIDLAIQKIHAFINCFQKNDKVQH